MKKISGFTLIELVITLIIISILAAMSSQMLSTVFSSYLSDKNITDASAQGMLALERMARDIREIRSSSDITTASATQLVFTNTDGVTVTYAISGSTLTLNGQVLADGISSLTFTYFDNTGTSTALTDSINYITMLINVTQGNTNFNMQTTVYPRDLI